MIACALVGVLRPSLLGAPGTAVVGVIGDLLYAAGVLVFAIGASRSASVVGRTPSGIASLAVVAVWPLCAQIGWAFLAGAESAGSAPAVAFGSLSLLVPTGAAIIAVAQIIRARVVPRPWHWAPAIALAAHVLAWTVPQLLFSRLDPFAIQQSAGALNAIAMLAFLVGTLGLGIVALVAAARERPASVSIFRSH